MDRKAMANETLEIMKRGYYEPSFRKDMGQVLLKREDAEEAKRVMRRRMKLGLGIFAEHKAIKVSLSVPNGERKKRSGCGYWVGADWYTVGVMTNEGI